MISLLCPTRGRPERAMQFLNSVLATQSGENEILFGLQNDDPRLHEYPSEIKSRAVYFEPVNTVHYWNELASQAKGDLLTLIGDDVIIRTPGWDDKFHAVHKQFPDDIYMITTQDGRGLGVPPDHLPSPHPTITRKWYETLGYLTFPDLTHYYADTWISTIAQKLRRQVNLYDVDFVHIKERDAVRANMARNNVSDRDRRTFDKNRGRLLDDFRLLEWMLNK